MYTHFSGRFIQVIESLDMYDACSNHVVNIDEYVKSEYGLKSEIYVRHFHPDREKIVKHIDHLNCTDEDIIVFHFSAYSEYCAEKVINSHGFKILHYHNITPHYFFEKGSFLYSLCKKGRTQLADIFNHFNFVTGDSYYNINEILELGFSKERALKLPIIIDDRKLDRVRNLTETGKDIIFVGRICENKCQCKLIEFYNRYRKNNNVGRLRLIGKFDSASSYYKKVFNIIKDLNLEQDVILTGAVTEGELDSFYKESACFISFSEHEGFGVPLLEASQYQIPVLALDKAAVSETLDNSPGIFSCEEDLVAKLKLVLSDEGYRNKLITYQNKVLIQNNYKSWKNYADKFFTTILPKKNQFKTFSVVICTFNRGDHLERCLDYLQKSYSKNFEVIIVNGPSDDNTEEVLTKWKSFIKVYNNPVRNLSISRNIGLNAASGDLVAFIDDDAIPFLDWFDCILNYFNNNHNFVAGVGGPTYYSGSLNFQAIDIFVDNFGSGVVNPPESIKKDPDYKRTLLGTNSVFRRDYLEFAGGFDEEYDYFLDETDVCFRLIKNGYTINHCPDAFLRHEFAQSENRKNKYGYNWYSIVKNTVYFALTYAKVDRNFIKDELEALVNRERISYIQSGLNKGEITQREYDEYCHNIWSGFKSGFDAIKHKPKLITLSSPLDRKFLSFKEDGCSFERLHIVIVSKEFPPFTKSGGIGTLYYNLASELLIAGHYVSVIIESDKANILERGRFKLIALEKGVVNSDIVHESELANSILNWSTRVAIEIDSLNEIHPIHVVDSCLWDAEAYSFSLINRELNIPLVIRLVTPLKVANEKNKWNMNEKDLGYLSGFELELVNRASAIVPISDSIKNTFINNYKPSAEIKYTKINAGIQYWPSYEVSQGYKELSNFPTIKNFSGKKIYLFLGRLELRKGIDILLDAIDLINNENGIDDIVFVIAGSSSIDINTILNTRFSGQDNIIYIGEVNDFDREKLYSLCDVVIFPSRYESFGLVPLEAFVHSKPVIASDSGAIPEVVLDNNCGLLFEDGNASELAKKIRLLSSDSDLYQSLSIGAKKRIRELSSYNSAVQSIKLYKKLLKGN